MNCGLRDAVAVNLPEVRGQLQSYGPGAAPSDPEKFRACIETGFDKWSRVVKDAGIKPH